MKAADSQRLLRNIGRRIGELRAERKLTQAAFAESVGVSVRYLQSVEGGRENLTVTSLASLADALEVSVVELFGPPARTKPRRGRPPKAGGSEDQ